MAQGSAQDTAQDNRLSMPLCAQIVDEARQVFGDGVKVIHAQEGGIERGTRPAQGVVPCL